MRAIYAVLLALVLGVAGCGGCGADVSGPVKEITYENIEHDGKTWRVNFESRFDAPVADVYAAFQEPERAHDLAPENVLKSELVSEEGNKKVVDLVGRLEILPPGFKVQQLRTEYVFYPDEKRFTTRTIDFGLADIDSEYKFEPADGGKATVLKFSQTSKSKAPSLTESLQKGALRETYITQVRVINKALGLEDDGADAGAEAKS
jgi:hypothetical protein